LQKRPVILSILLTVATPPYTRAVKTEEFQKDSHMHTRAVKIEKLACENRDILVVCEHPRERRERGEKEERTERGKREIRQKDVKFENE